MAVTLKNDVEKGAGYELLVFDRLINAPRLQIALFQHNTSRYLTDKAHWQNQPSYSLVAERVSASGNQSIFRLGPEITVHIPAFSMITISTEDGSVNETMYWEDALVQIVPEVTATTAAETAAAAAAAAAEHTRLQEAAAAAAAAAAAEKTRLEKEAAAAAAEQKRLEEEAVAVAAAAAAETTRLEKEAAAAAARKRWEERRQVWMARLAWLRSPAVVWSAAVVLLASGALAGSFFLWDRFKDELCDISSIFCDDDGKVYQEARLCAAGKKCGVSTCTAAYRQTHPKGRHAGQIAEIDRLYGDACIGREEEEFNKALACLNTNEIAKRQCDAAACFQQFSRQYPNSPRVTQAVQTRHRKAVDECRLSRERPVFDAGANCARSNPCDAESCFANYRRLFFPGALLRQQMDGVLTRARDECLKSQPPASPPLPAPPVTPALPLPPPPSLPDFVQRTVEKPSFDCSKRPMNPVAEMICADAHLATADGELGEIYNARRRALRGADRDALTKAQFDWIENRDRNCGVPQSGAWTTMDLRRLKKCLLDATRARRDALARN